jgi:hypothetical protein
MSVDSAESVDADAVYKEYLHSKYERRMEEILAQERENLRAECESQLQLTITRLKEELDIQVSKRERELQQDYQHKIDLAKAEFAEQIRQIQH